MASASPTRATLDDLLREEGKAELTGGRIVRFMDSGDLPSVVPGEIFPSLRQYARATRQGVAYPDGIGYSIPKLPSGRESFSPDASYHVGGRPSNPMRSVEGPPTFAVEVRSENDYGPAAEAEMAAKRADYFAAGTLVVYRAATPDRPVTYRRGDVAEAEPAVPGWRPAVDDLFSA